MPRTLQQAIEDSHRLQVEFRLLDLQIAEATLDDRGGRPQRAGHDCGRGMGRAP